MGVKTILRASRLAATPAMTDDSRLSFNLPSVSRKKVTAAFDGGRLSSDSGVLLLALADRRRAVADTLAALIADHRDPAHITHTVADVLRARMLAIGCGYPDGNDFDRLRFDPAFKLACGRLPDTGGDLCSQPTISRWENAPTLREIIRLTYALVDIWCRSYQKPPRFVVLDVDDTADVVHAPRQLGQWTAHYDERCFLPIHVYDAATGAPVTVILRPGKTPSGVEVRKLLSRLIGRIRRHWPSTHITIRGDGHYGREEAMTWCENYGIDYIFGLSGTVVLDRLVDAAANDIRVRRAVNQAELVRGFAETRYAAKSWDKSSSNRLPRSLRTTLFGSARPCRRAARFGVSPTMPRSWASPEPMRSPTTTRPVAIPTRACKGTRIVSAATAATISSPARTACSASCSWALGYPKYTSTPSPMYFA